MRQAVAFVEARHDDRDGDRLARRLSLVTLPHRYHAAIPGFAFGDLKAA
jgi:hypothetical protein